MREEDTPTVFTAGKQKLKFMDPFNGNTKPIVKILVIVAVLLTVAAIAVTANWSGMFRESGISAESQRANAEAIRRIELDYVRRAEFEQMLKRMEHMDDKLDRILQLQAQERRNR